jgi:hypothetical protein
VEDGDVNAIFSEMLGILGQADVFEPLRDMLHPRPRGSNTVVNDLLDRSKFSKLLRADHVLAARHNRAFLIYLTMAASATQPNWLPARYRR